MKDPLYNLLIQENIEFAEVGKEAVLNACINAHMDSESGDCKPGNS